MTDTNKSLIVVVLDRSGSMSTKKEEVIGGFNKLLNEQQASPGTCLWSMIQFDDQLETLYNLTPIKDVKELNNETFVPRGWTRLLDALGTTIVKTGEELSKMKEEERPARVLLLTFSDGQENSSREYSATKVKEMIEHQKTKYNWEFVYMGCDQAAIEQAKDLGYGHVQAYASIGQMTTKGLVATSNALRSWQAGKGYNQP